MNFKKLLVSFVMLVSTLFLLSTVSAGLVGSNGDFTVTSVRINDVDVSKASLIAGELVTIKVAFEAKNLSANESISDVRVTIELDGDKVDVEGTTSSFDVISGKTYIKSMVLRVPFELQDEVSSDLLSLNIEIKGNSVDSYDKSEKVTVQRPSYNVDFMSVNTGQTIEAGKTFSVDVVIKNTGFNKLDDLYVTVSIPELEIERTVYAGDLIQVEGEVFCLENTTFCITTNEDEEDSVEVTVKLTVPYDAVEGSYNLEVEAKNNDMKLNVVKQIFVKNDFSSNVIVSGNQLVLLNPTDNLMALRLVIEAPEGVSVTLSESIVVVPAGSSKAVTVSATGGQEYTINVFTMNGNLVESVKLAASSASAGSNVVTVLTAVLLVVFLVLLAVLVVLVTKKPEKDEELSESYY